MKISTAAQFSILFFAIALLALVPDFAFAASPFAPGATTLKSDLIAILTPIIGIGLVVLGVLCGFGKVNWMWFVGAIFGIILIFGHDQIIQWIRTTFSI